MMSIMMIILKKTLLFEYTSKCDTKENERSMQIKRFYSPTTPPPPPICVWTTKSTNNNRIIYYVQIILFLAICS